MNGNWRDKGDNESLMIRKCVYQRNLGRAYNNGAVMALTKIGKTTEEIAEILELKESHVRHLQSKDYSN